MDICLCSQVECCCMTKQVNKNAIKFYKFIRKNQSMAYYKKDQLSIKTRKLLADYLADLILITDSIESFRIALAETQYFNGIQLFRWLDKDEKGYLTPQDFSPLVSDETKKVFHYAFSWFDVSKVGEITRAQFLQFLFPQTNSQLRNLISERMVQQYTPQERKATMPIQQDLFRQLLVQLMQKETRLIPIRRNLMDQEDYTLKAVMNCLDAEGRGWITTGDFYKFLRNFDIDVNPNKVCCMLGVFDDDLNGKISISELHWLIQGLENNLSRYRKIIRQSDQKAKAKLTSQRCSCHKKGIGRSTGKVQYKQTQHENRAQTDKKKIKIEGKDESQKKKHENSKQNQIRKKAAVSEFSEKSKNKKEKKTRNEIGMISEFEYLDLKKAVLELQRLTNQADEDLIRIEQEMGARTQVEFQRQLENAHIRRKIKKQEEQMVQLKMRELERLQHEKQVLRRVKEEQLLEEQSRKLAQIEKFRSLERENEYLKQIEEWKFRQAELQSLRVRNLQQAKFREIQNRRAIEMQQNRQSFQNLTEIKLVEQENRRHMQLEQSRLENLRKVKQMQLNNLLSKKRLYEQQLEREASAGQKLRYPVEFSWNTSQKLRELHEKETRHRLGKESGIEKENQYFDRYNNYCQNLATVVDPLGIKEHLAQTDKYLVKSKELRDQIKRDRTYSLNKFSNLRASNRNKSRVNTQNDELGEKTPEHRKNVIETINKRTQQTKLAWSEN